MMDGLEPGEVAGNSGPGFEAFETPAGDFDGLPPAMIAEVDQELTRARESVESIVDTFEAYRAYNGLPAAIAMIIRAFEKTCREGDLHAAASNYAGAVYVLAEQRRMSVEQPR